MLHPCAAPLQSALSRSADLAMDMCDQFADTPLFRRYVRPALNSSEGNSVDGDGLVPPPGGYNSRQEPAFPADSPPADLLPALYMVASALPTYNESGRGLRLADCTGALLEAAGVPEDDNATVNVDRVSSAMINGLMKCTMYEESLAEAHRCLYAVPLVAAVVLNGTRPAATAAAILNDKTLPWLFALGGQRELRGAGVAPACRTPARLCLAEPPALARPRHHPNSPLPPMSSHPRLLQLPPTLSQCCCCPGAGS